MLLSRVDHILHIRTKTWPKITFKSLLLVKNAVLETISLKLYIALQILQNAVNLKSICMQTISDKMYFDIIANRQKKIYLQKWTIITFVKCRGMSVCSALLAFLVPYSPGIVLGVQ